MVLQIPSFVKNIPTGKPSARLVESLSAFAARPANCWWWTLPGVYHFHPPFNGGGWRRREACAYCHHETGGVRTDESGMYDESTRINGLKSRLDLSGGKLFSLFNGLPKVGSTRHHKTSVPLVSLSALGDFSLFPCRYMVLSSFWKRWDEKI